MNSAAEPAKATPMRADLLIEIGCEELPPKSLPLLGKTLLREFTSQLDKNKIGFDPENSRVYYTPRRLALLLSGVSDRQADQVIERKGPAVAVAFDANGEPTPAALGFARSVGKPVTDLDTLKSGKGEWLFCRLEKPGATLETLLYPMLQNALDRLPVAKPMRWASNDFSFIRPVHWIVVLYGTQIIDGQLFGLKAGRCTRGHRIHGPGPHEIGTPGDYEAVLEKAFVIADPVKRSKKIREQAVELGISVGGHTLMDKELLEEVANLVEWPVAICGSFDNEFLQVPPEALIASMQDHQKFFPVLDADQGELTSRFITIANLKSRDFDAVREGFERVIRPRLADARFFWEQDNKSSLDSNLPILDGIVFQKKLGTVGDKSRRISDISGKIAEVTGHNQSSARRAAMLCKCDLASHMVGEFPELQGVMGRYYAEQSGETGEVAHAIGDHYLPAYSGGDLPGQAIGKIVALSDKLDTLTGIFAIGLKPTGNKDPFALRRAALGLIRILIDGEILLNFSDLFKIGKTVLERDLEVSEEASRDLEYFVRERIKHYLKEQQFETGLVNATLDAPLSTLPDLISRLGALQDFMVHAAADSLVAANKRIGNILRKSGAGFGGEIDEDKFIIDEERLLFNEIREISQKTNRYFSDADYTSALGLLAGLSDVIEKFFDQVMVMDENPEIRNNRLNLLARLKSLFDRIANFALIG